MPCTTDPSVYEDEFDKIGNNIRDEIRKLKEACRQYKRAANIATDHLCELLTNNRVNVISANLANWWQLHQQLDNERKK